MTQAQELHAPQFLKLLLCVCQDFVLVKSFLFLANKAGASMPRGYMFGELGVIIYFDLLDLTLVFETLLKTGSKYQDSNTYRQGKVNPIQSGCVRSS